MTDVFAKLQTAAKTVETKESGWVKTNRKPLVIGASAILVVEAIVLCVVKML